MVKTRKFKFTAIMLSFIIILEFLPIMNVKAAYETPNYSNAVSSYSELQQRLNSLIEKYVGTYWTTNGKPAASDGKTSRQYYGIQCNGFAKYIFNDLFCTGNIGPYDGNKYYFPSPNGANLVGKAWNFGSNDTTTVKGILSKANIGDIIQVRRRGKSWGHTMIISGVHDDGIDIFDCNSDGMCGVKHYYQSYSTFASKNVGMSLYHSTKYPDVTPATSSPIGVVDNCSGGKGSIYVRGWGFDPDDKGNPIGVHIYLGTADDVGVCVGGLSADVSRADVNDVHGCGNNHGYEGKITTDITPGTYYLRVGFLDNTGDNSSWATGGYITIEPADKTAPVISDIEIINANNEGYTIRLKATDDTKVENVSVASWADDCEQDADCKWTDFIYHENYWYADIKFSDHNNNNKVGYQNHIYAFDEAKNSCFGYIHFVPDTEKPSILTAYITDLSHTGYMVHCTASDDVGVKKVQFPTWTDKPDSSGNPQDDIVWGDGSYVDGEYLYRVNVEDHNNETGVYITHIYVFDEAGNYEAIGLPSVTVQDNWTKPLISDVKVTDVSAEGYTITCKVTDDIRLSRVQFPTWNSIEDKNGNAQDDITWEFGYVDGDIYTYRVNLSEHNNEKGTYYTHIYAFDCSNNYAVYGIELIPQDSYKVTLNANGGSCSTQSINVANGAKYGTLPTPTRNGYEFIGWFTAKENGNQIKSDTVFSNYFDLTLYAQWKAVPVTTTVKPPTTTTTKPTTTTDKPTTTTVQTTTIPVEIILKGDVNNDGKITVTDAVMLQKWLLGSGELTCWQAADLCKDGRIDVFDMVAMRKLLIEKTK